MYRKHFALTAFPFDLTPPPDALFAAASLTEAAARLKHLLELRAIGLITGEAGSGKTTVCRKVAADLHPALTTVHINGGAIGRQAAQFIVERAEGRAVEPRVVDIGFSIVERSSV